MVTAFLQQHIINYCFCCEFLQLLAATIQYHSFPLAQVWQQYSSLKNEQDPSLMRESHQCGGTGKIQTKARGDNHGQMLSLTVTKIMAFPFIATIVAQRSTLLQGYDIIQKWYYIFQGFLLKNWKFHFYTYCHFKETHTNVTNSQVYLKTKK